VSLKDKDEADQSGAGVSRSGIRSSQGESDRPAAKRGASTLLLGESGIKSALTAPLSSGEAARPAGPSQSEAARGAAPVAPAGPAGRPPATTQLLGSASGPATSAPVATADSEEMYAQTQFGGTEEGSVARRVPHERAPAPVTTGAPAATVSYGQRPPTLRDETHIGQYEIIRKLGEGGMGVVYLARDTRLGRRVAVKVLRTQDPELTRRFIIEARTTARCTHENIVIIHDAGEHNGSPYMVLEYLEGKTLADFLDTEPPSIPRAVEIMVSVVRALVRAHEESIVHRDLKPDNVFITESGTVKVLDFGIAKLLERGPSASSPARAARGSLMAEAPRSISTTGIAGTAGYMSPEQWESPGAVDHRSDIWAVGCCLFELVTGRNPLMELGDPVSVATFLAGPAPMPSALDWGARIPRPLSEIIDKCLKKRREERFSDARSLLKALEPFLPGRRLALDGPVDLSPFAGLRAFQEEDASRFFGRSRELGTLLSRLRETPLMATVGPSGAGKSSFLRAGVIPALKNSGDAWEVLVLRPGRAPLQQLAEQLRPYLAAFAAERAGSVPPPADDEQVVRRLVAEPGFLGALLRSRCRSAGTRLLLFVDQFEELYTLGAPPEERRALASALLGAADDAVSPVRVMLSLRADFVGRTTEDPEFVATLSKGLFFLGPPSATGLREALVRPAEMMGYRFESNAIVDEMIRFLDGTPGGLPLLQFTAAQLWDARDPQNRLLTLQSYRGMGGVEGALVSHADSVYNQLPKELKSLCRRLFMHLVTSERTRAIRSMRELEDLSGDGAALRRLVDHLVDSRLWVVTTQEGDPTVEIVHESLITTWPSLRRWLDESHEDSVFVDQLLAAAQQWETKRRDAGLLWRGEMGVELEHFARKYQGPLPEVARDFVDAVRQQAVRAARRRRLTAVAGIAVLVTLLMAATVGLYVVNQERQSADRNARIAEQRLADQIRAERQRRAADEQRRAAEERQKQAEKKSVVLEDQVKLSADELAIKNAELQIALRDANANEEEARRLQAQAEQSERAAREASRRAQETSAELKVLLDKERARAERLDAQIGQLVEEL
jgi:serine/threonine protein kinase